MSPNMAMPVARAEEMFGLSSHELVGTSLSTYLVAPGSHVAAGDVISRHVAVFNNERACMMHIAEATNAAVHI